MHVDLLVPVKLLAHAKTRLRGAADAGAGSPEAHATLALAMARDTLAAARAARTVRRVVAICSDRTASAVLAGDGVDIVPDAPGAGLNAALRHGAALLREADPAAAVATLPADLPALCPEELDEALRDGLSSGGRAFCADREGTGTVLLLAAAGRSLDPRFGADSAREHRVSGARELLGGWPRLRCDVDTRAALDRAVDLGLGRFSRAALAAAGR